MKKLEKLDMETTTTKTFDYDAFKQMKNLSQLKLSGYSTIEIHQNFFEQHPNLESLDLSELIKYDKNSTTINDKYCIDLKALANLTALKSLNLSNNNLNIDHKEGEMIFRLENLEKLDLSFGDRNKFIKRELELNETTFERMTKLRVLNLSGNQIKLEGNCFQHLKQLKELNISNTDLKSNDDYDIFGCLKRLE